MKTKSLAFLLFVGLTGCLIMSNEKTEVEGTEVSEETLSQIEPGSPEDLVLALLGEPTTRQDLSDGTTLLRWQYRKTTKKGSAVLVIFAGSTKREESGRIYVLLRDAKVEKVWRDGHQPKKQSD
jgi:outer membrane protein assembly factor BamE (lipoprotein component of BamABCDE complex)